MLDLSVIIITWKMKENLQALLGSIYEITKGISYEIVVVDNDSRDGTVEMIRKEFKDVKLIQNDRNRGVAPARNQGFKLARGRYLVTLDADMILTEDSLKKLVDFMDSTPSAGLVGCRLVSSDGTVQPSARRFPTPFAFVLRRLEFLAWARNSRTLRRHEMAEWDRSDIREVDYVIGACQFIRRETMDQVGLLDERIFYGPEDVDYCLRTHRQGWKVFYFPLTSIVHFEQRMTKKKLFSKITWRHLKGIIYLFIKYRGKLSSG